MAPHVVAAALDSQFGQRRFIWDPSDPEANNRLVAEGYTPIKGGHLTAGQWDNVKRHCLAQPAGTISPSPKPYDPNGRPENVIPFEKWSDAQKRTMKFVAAYAAMLLGKAIDVKLVREPGVYWGANYGRCSPLTMNLGKLGHGFFDGFPANMAQVIDLVIHELGHEYSSNHLDESYYKGLTRLGAKSTLLALENPAFFRQA